MLAGAIAEWWRLKSWTAFVPMEMLLSIIVMLAAAAPAAAHSLPPADAAHLDMLVMQAVNSQWAGLLAVVASGLVLGALHGLEPGHSKTMMSAFIIAIRGTVGQAMLLGASAAVSHTLVVWLLAIPALLWGEAINPIGSAPYFQIVSAAAVLAVAGWTTARIVRQGHDRDHDHDPLTGEHIDNRVTHPTTGSGGVGSGRIIDTGHGLVRLEIVVIDGVAHFVVSGVSRSGRSIPFNDEVTVDIQRHDGGRDRYCFAVQDDRQVSVRAAPPPHRFVATLRIGHDDHVHAFPVAFARPDEAPVLVEDNEGSPMDAHERAHVLQIKRRLASGQPMTTWQIVFFGLSGGLVPCPAAVTVLMLCLQLKQFSLGMLLVSSFSLGLAATMIAAGCVTALGIRHLGRRFSGFERVARPATYASCALMIGIGLYMLGGGLVALA